MKKKTLLLMTIFLSSTSIPLQSMAETKAVSTTMPVPVPEESQQAKRLIERLNEIKLMDKSKLNSSEKKLLRTEVRQTKKQLKNMGGGIYLSVGAIIIILLLLIIIL